MLRAQHVLVIEDEPLIALDLEQALSSAGAAAKIAYTVASALEAADAVTAAIVDLRLHDHSVRDVVGRLATRKLPFIFYSGQAESATAAAWPNVPLLLKPLSAKEVVDMLARVAKAVRGSITNEKGWSHLGNIAQPSETIPSASPHLPRTLAPALFRLEKRKRAAAN